MNRKTKIMKLMLFFLCFLFHQLLLVSKDNWIHLMKIKRRTVNPKSWLVNLSKKNRNKTNHEGNVHSSQGTTTWKRQKLVCCGSYSCIFVSWGLCSFISCRFKPQETIPREVEIKFHDTNRLSPLLTSVFSFSWSKGERTGEDRRLSTVETRTFMSQSKGFHGSTNKRNEIQKLPATK